MASRFCDSLVADIEDPVAVLDGAQPVGHNNAGPVFQHFPDAFLQQLFRLRINGGCCFVENQDRGIAQQRPRKGNQLFLTLAQVVSALLHFRPVAHGHPPDQFISPYPLCRLLHFRVCGIQAAVSDIVHHRAAENKAVLHHDSQPASQ